MLLEKQKHRLFSMLWRTECNKKQSCFAAKLQVHLKLTQAILYWLYSHRIHEICIFRFTYIWLICMVNASKYTRHGAYGIHIQIFLYFVYQQQAGSFSYNNSLSGFLTAVTPFFLECIRYMGCFAMSYHQWRRLMDA